MSWEARWEWPEKSWICMCNVNMRQLLYTLNISLRHNTYNKEISRAVYRKNRQKCLLATQHMYGSIQHRYVMMSNLLKVIKQAFFTFINKKNYCLIYTCWMCSNFYNLIRSKWNLTSLAIKFIHILVYTLAKCLLRMYKSVIFYFLLHSQKPYTVDDTVNVLSDQKSLNIFLKILKKIF